MSRIEQPLIARASIALWRLFGDIDLSDAETTRFASMHACFTRRLRPGARTVDPDPRVLASPCDAIVGAGGRIAGDELLQIKGAPYSLAAGMYHHFHAPHDLMVDRIRHIPGDCWNVNPPALARIDRLFCRNERAAIHVRLDGGGELVLITVAAILVAGIRLCFVDGGLRALAGNRLALAVRLPKGAEMGWFEHGSTIVIIAPPGFAPAPAIREGEIVRMGRRCCAAGITADLPVTM